MRKGQFFESEAKKLIGLSRTDLALWERQTPSGLNEKRAMKIVNLIDRRVARRNKQFNYIDDALLKLWGSYSKWEQGTSNYLSDTKGDLKNKYNMKVLNVGTTFDVDESQAKYLRNYETYVVHKLVNNFKTGNGPTNYNFKENGIISSKFWDSNILNAALKDYADGKSVRNTQYEYRGAELIADIYRNRTMFGSITGYAGSGAITIYKAQRGLEIQIFNITSLYSGDILKKVGLRPAKSYVRDREEKTPYGNISQTFNLHIPKNILELSPYKR